MTSIVRRALAIHTAVLAMTLPACSRSADEERPSGATAAGAAADAAAAAKPAGKIVVYSGRSESLVGPILERFEKQHGVDIEVKYGDTAALAALLIEEADRTPAAAFFAQDVGAVGALSRRSLLAPLPAEIVDRVPPAHRAQDATWVGVTGRVRTVVYNPDKVKEADLPASVLDLTKPRWKGKVGWAPTNASFQAFVTAMRVALGEEKAEAWLRAMKDNGAREYPKNGAIVQAVASGGIDAGLVNHYYLIQMQKDDPKIAARNHYTAPADPGSLVNLAAFAVLKGASPDEARAAEALGRYLLSDETQAAFVAETGEYPLVAGAPAPAGLRPLSELESPMKDLGALHDLEGTLALLRKTGVLP